MIELSELSTPLGSLGVAERSGKLLAVSFGGLAALEEQHPELWELDEVKSQKRASSLAKELKAYLASKSGEARLPVDLSLVPGEFDRAVLKRLSRVRFGKTISYGALADAVGKPSAARAVGGAMRRNPLPIVVPCHRVLPQSGGLGNYTGGVDKKAWLLRREGVSLSG